MRQKLLTGFGLVMVAALVAGCAGHGYGSRRSHGWHGKYSQHGKSSQHKNLERKFFKKAHRVRSSSMGARSTLARSAFRCSIIRCWMAS